MRQNNAIICSVCCAKIRNQTCVGCSYHTAARQYHADRSPRNLHVTPPEGHFIIKLDPELEKAVDSALDLCDQGNTDAAWAQVTRLLGEHPGNHMVHYAMGVLHAFKGENEECIEWFDKAIATYPFFVEAHFNKSVSYQKQFKIAQAVYAYRKVVEFGDPNDTPARQARSFLDDIAVAIRKNDGIDLDSYIESQQIFDRAFARMEQGEWSGALTDLQACAAKHAQCTRSRQLGIVSGKTGA